MSISVEIGKVVEPGKSGPLMIDVDRLVETRLLVQANSGGGKSYAIRKLLESTYGKIQHIVIDIEGEFGTLREKFDYILVGQGGDIPADLKTAELLAHKLLELEANAIINLYELKQHDRIKFVKFFLNAMVNAPKSLWHPCLVVVDECHIFCPENGHAESAEAVTDLATRGRKRGFCIIPATQRLPKLDKDLAAECMNKLIGRTGLDIDMKRAADELGFSRTDMLTLRDLDAGEFFAFGPAISKQVTKMKIGPVETTHPKAGKRIKQRAPAAPAKVKAMLAKLTDLLQEAEIELKDRESMRVRIKELEHELKKQPKQEADPVAIEKAVERARNETLRAIKPLVEKANRQIRRIKEMAGEFSEVALPTETPQSIAPVSISRYERPVHTTAETTKVEIDGRVFGQCERKILGFLSLKPGQSFTKVQVGAMTGYRHKSGGFNNAISNLSKSGLIVRGPNQIALNLDVDVSDLIDSTPHALGDWVAKLGACERAIYQLVLQHPDKDFEKQEVADMTGYSAGSGGFNNALSRLNTLGLVRRQPGGALKLNEEISSL